MQSKAIITATKDASEKKATKTIRASSKIDSAEASCVPKVTEASILCKNDGRVANHVQPSPETSDITGPEHLICDVILLTSWP